MQPWPIPLNGNFRIPISADYRHAEIDYLNDVTWELVSGGGEPAALSIQTTAGLRMGALRFFPRIAVGQTTRCDPREFVQAPQITRLSPGSLTVKAEPAAGLRVRMDVTICTSQTISGRLLWHNSSAKEMEFTLEWVGQLSPLGEGEPMSAQVNGVHTALFGRSGELQPVCYLTGGAYGGEGVYPALALDIHLAAGETREVSWACALHTDAEESFDQTRQLTSRTWDAELARIDMGDTASLLEAESGDPDWDRAFLLTQREAQRLLLTGGGLPHPSFVLSRRPDQGFSLHSTGSDFPPAWSGQTALDAWQISGSLLPGSRELVLGLLRNFLSVQTADGSIDWRPGLAGQRSRHLAQPMLAGLADRIGGDEAGELFSGLLRFYDHWFSPIWDRDGDGFPEWEHAVQTGLEDAPIYDRWNPDGHGVDIRSLEAPGLAALLLREGLSLREMARTFGSEEQAALLTGRCQGLQQVLNETWDAAAGTFRYRDPATHLSLGPITMVEMDAPGVQRLRMLPGAPRRLLLRVEAVPGERTRPLHVTITGKNEDGDVEEEIPSGRIHWARNVGRFTTRNVFTQVEQVRVAGLPPGDRAILMGADASREDVSLLLPLWAGACSAQQAAEMVERCFPRYMSRFGLRLWPGGKAVHPGWNQLIGDGLINSGQDFAALNLLERLMTAVVPCVLSTGRFAEAYDAETGAPLGESTALHGLAPLGLFLQVLGIQQLGTNLLVWRGKSVFPRPVKLQYRGMKLIIDREQVRVSFTNGQQVTVDGPGAQRIFLG